MSFQIGEQIGPYQVEQQLGQGGMATVYKAYHANLDRYVALKVIHSVFREDEAFLSRFKREARLIARLEHPNIVPVYNFDEHNGHAYLVMRYIEGQTIKGLMRQGKLTIDDITRIVDAVGGALDYAHMQGVLHRDVKPSNIMIDKGGRIFLTDFGLARLVQAAETTLSQDMLLGTPQYISPEQARGDDTIDGRADLYSFAVVLYECLIGRVPFTGDTPYAIVHDHIFKPLPLPSTLNPDISMELEGFLIRALAKTPEERFARGLDLVSAYHRAVEMSGEYADALPFPPDETPPPAPLPAYPGHEQAAAAPAPFVLPPPAPPPPEPDSLAAPKASTKSRPPRASVPTAAPARSNVWAIVALILLLVLLIVSGWQVAQVWPQEYQYIFGLIRLQ